MEPLSVTASIIAILQLSSKVIKYVNGAAGAATERKRLRDEVRSCESILQRLKDEADDADEGKLWLETIKALEAPDAPLYRLGVAFRVVIEILEPKKGLEKALSALKWPFDEKEVEKIFSTIEREKTLLALALTNDCRKLIKAIKKSSNENESRLAELIVVAKENSSKLAELKDGLWRTQGSQADLKDGLDQLHDRQHNREATEEREAILNWLTLIDYAPQQNDFINRRQAGTGQWLLDSQEFKKWVETDKQTMFCPGIPGAGKTIITSIVVKTLCSRFQGDISIGIAYLYCNFRRQQKQKPEDLLASLLKQLVQGRPSVPENVKGLYGRHKDKRTRPSLEEISIALHAVITDYSKAFIIIDALDECQVSDGGRRRLLLEIFNVQARTRVSFFATSRHIPEIEREFEGSISLEIRASDADVQRYLDSHMLDLPSFVVHSRDLQEKIKSEIIKAVDGMFLLAWLHLGSLVGKRSPKAIRAALEKLPTGSGAYDHAYNDAMERINGQIEDSRELAKEVLSWIICAKRPLTTLELRHALAVEVGESKLDEENLPELKDMVSVCAGLVTIDGESHVVRLVHYTTQEYFERTQKDWFPNAQTDITTTCATYLSFDTFETGFCPTDKKFRERLQLNPFYDYAAQNWGHHARANSADIERRILGLLENEAKASGCSQAMMASGSYSGYSQRVPRQVTGVHIAAYFGLVKTIMGLLKKGDNPDLQDSYEQTPLLWAARNGHEAVVELLLAMRKVDVDSKNKYGQTPLSWAAESGHEAVAELLLATGKVDVDSKDSNGGRTPLSWAARNGHEAMVKLLLATGRVDVDSKDSNGGQTPLSWAAESGHEAVVKLLLATGKVDVDSKDKYGRAPLSWAARNGHEAVVKLLLATGKVDVGSKDDNGGQTPLSWAAESGHEAVVKLLLATGKVDVDSKD
ncbi:MAG: hypothetical protein M1839_002528, partial [Geoglossum umbratile]